MKRKRCTKCGEQKPINAEFFNLLPSGSFRGTCKSCMAANTKKHYQLNPEKAKQRVSKYKIAACKAGGKCTREDVAAIRAKLGDKCFYCATPLNGRGEVDHKTPISQGGSNWPYNRTLACRTCNRDKHGKTVSEFRKWRRDRGLAQALYQSTDQRSKSLLPV